MSDPVHLDIPGPYRVGEYVQVGMSFARVERCYLAPLRDAAPRLAMAWTVRVLTPAGVRAEIEATPTMAYPDQKFAAYRFDHEAAFMQRSDLTEKAR